MAKKSSTSLGNTQTLVHIAAALFFITLGIVELTAYNSGVSEFTRSATKAFGGKNDISNIIIPILELISGIIILGSVFVPVKKRLLFIATFVIGVIWVIQIIVYFFMNNIFEPNFFVWLNRLAVDLLVLAAVWMINRSRKS
jgi:hypothetical protein